MFKIEVAISGESLPVVSIRGQVEHMDKRWIHILQAHWCWSFYEGRTPPQGLATSPLISPPGTTLRSWFPTHFFFWKTAHPLHFTQTEWFPLGNCKAFMWDPLNPYPWSSLSQEMEAWNYADGQFSKRRSCWVQFRKRKLTPCLQTFLIALSSWQL